MLLSCLRLGALCGCLERKKGEQPRDVGRGRVAGEAPCVTFELSIAGHCKALALRQTHPARNWGSCSGR